MNIRREIYMNHFSAALSKSKRSTRFHVFFQFQQRIRGIQIMTTTTEMIMQTGHRFSIEIFHMVSLLRSTARQLFQQQPHHNDVIALKCEIVHRWWRNW